MFARDQEINYFKDTQQLKWKKTKKNWDVYQGGGKGG